ncbi:MAG: Zn-dependent hydrolase [Bacteroidetes bacterium]|nr:MAG: Zn-dependent hydrolase [Bacteroidota bacterium]
MPLRVNADRLNQSLADLARIGAIDGGGVCRLAFTDEDKAGRDLVEARMRALGLEVRIDAIGNLVGIRPGREEGPIVMTGSHLDTVGRGGRYDGALGVLAGLEVLATLQEAGITTRRPLAVAAFVNEEGNRFTPDVMGSLFFRGDLDLDAVRATVGIDGTTLGDNLDRTGMAGPDDFRDLPLRAFVELHIEQGPVLEEDGVTIGVVDGVQGILWHEFRVQGASNHAGVTPMDRRQDAGFVAAAIAAQVRHLARSIRGQRATVGTLEVEPGYINIIPDRARLTADLRNPDGMRLREMAVRLLGFAQEVAAAEGVALEHRELAHIPPVRFDEEVVAAIEQAAEACGYTHRRMTSGAGHDAQILATRCPTAMLFVPSVGGVSHDVTEYTRPEDVAAGANVLLHTIRTLAA